MKQAARVGWGLVVLLIAACNSTPNPAPTATLSPATAAVTAPATAAATAAATADASLPAPTATEAANLTPGATPSESPTEGNITTDDVTPVAAGEVVKLSGNSFATSDTYRFSSDTTLEITWNYTGTAPFALWLVNVSDVVTDPDFDRVLVDDITGPHAGTTKTKIIAGDWTVQVEQGEGPWTVEFKPES